MLINEARDYALDLLNSISGGDAVARSLIMLWALTSFSWLGRKIPLKIWAFVKHHSTVGIAITKEDDARSQEFFTNFEEWFFNNNWFANRNRMAAFNGLADGNGFGYGKHFVFCRGRLYLVEKSRLQQGSVSGKVMETFSVTTVGRNPTIYEKIVAASKISTGKRYFWSKGDRWSINWTRREINTRSPKLYLDETVKGPLDKKLEFFIENREWYTKERKPYRMNIVLYGPPGTGKTELTRYIADKLDADIYQSPITVLSMETIISIARSLVPGRKAVIALEDFEAIALSRDFISFRQQVNRVEDSENEEKKAEHEELKKDARYEVNKSIMQRSSEFTISDLLNTLQGLQIIEDLIIVMTTNHIEVIDEAILRGSRCDLKLYVGPLGIKQVKEKFQDTYKMPLPAYIGTIKPIKACDVDDMFSNFVDDPDGLVEKLIADYGVEEKVEKTESKPRTLHTLDRAMINTGFALSRDAVNECTDFNVNAKNVYTNKTTELFFQYWILTKDGIDWVNRFVDEKEKTNA